MIALFIDSCILDMMIGGTMFECVPLELMEPKFVEEVQEAVRKIKDSKLFKDSEFKEDEAFLGGYFL